MYLAYKHFSTQGKNALDKSFEDYLDEIDRTLIKNENIDAFCESVLSRYHELSLIHHRCKPRLGLGISRDRSIGGKIQRNLESSHVNFYFIKSKD